MSRAPRTGLTTIRGLAFTMCRIVSVSTPIITHYYGDSAVLIAALEAANVACAELVKQADSVLPVGD